MPEIERREVGDNGCREPGESELRDPEGRTGPAAHYQPLPRSRDPPCSRPDQRHSIAPTICRFMDTSSATAQDHLRKVIDDEIKVHEQAAQELKYRRNALAPISRLPPETLIEIFSLLPIPTDEYERVPYLARIRVTHVCHRWREVALYSPSLWNHINFTKLTLAGLTEILARAKTSPLYFEANKITPLYMKRFASLGSELEAHISHTRHLTISGEFPGVLERLVSPAPALVSLTLTKLSASFPQCIIPNSLFNGTAPKLTRLELFGYNIRWKSPLLKGLQTLNICAPSTQAMPRLDDWLTALDQMSQLKTLMLSNATPAVSAGHPRISEMRRTVTLPSLTHFDISASAKGCALALAHLVLPALISLHVTSISQSWDGADVRSVIPYVARNAHGPQDTAPLQTILLDEEAMHVKIVAWTVPEADAAVCDLLTLVKASASARLVFLVTPDSGWTDGTETVIFDAMLSRLPLNAISTLSAQNNARLSKEVWLSHAPRLAMLKRALLVPTAVRAFREMLEEDATPNDLPRLPQLTKLILSKASLTALRTYHLRNMLVKRKEHGAPLEVLDLRSCIGTDRAIQLLSEIVGNVQGPATTLKEGLPAFFNWERRVGPFDEEEERTDDDEYDDGPGPWYAPTDEEENDEEEDDFDLDLYVDQ